MVAPSSRVAPRVKQTTIVGNIHDTYEYQYGARQKAPYTDPLPYVKYAGSWSRSPGANGSGYYGSDKCDAATIYAWGYNPDLMDRATNKAYDQLKGKVYDTAGLGVDCVEYRQSLNMISRTCSTLVKAFKQVKHGNFIGASQTLRTHVVPKNVSTRKSAANNWLEYHFGWAPLVSDVYDSVEVLNNPIKAYTKVKGRGSESYSESYSQMRLGAVVEDYVFSSQYHVQMGCFVKSIDNPTVHALDQFGILNPLSLVWETVPFSFLVDWFVNVGDMLESLSDYAGMTLGGQYTSRLYRSFVYNHIDVYHPISGDPDMYVVDGWNAFTGMGTGVMLDRYDRMLSPVLAARGLKLPSKARAATAISLLIQGLR